VAGSFIDRIKSFFKAEKDEEYDENGLYSFDENERKRFKGSRKNKVVNIHSALSQKVVIAQPSRFEEMTDLCECIKKKKILIVNLSKLENDVAARCFDFACGVVYALGGEIQQISNRVLLMTPGSVEVSSGIDERNSGRKTWLGSKP